MFQNLSNLLRWAGVGIALSLASPATAQTDYPSKPVRVVVPFSAGGSTDMVARLFADQLSKVLGESFVVENRGGGDTIIGTTAVANAAPDGYTLLLSSPSLMSNHWLRAGNLTYDTTEDLTGVALLTRGEWLLAANPNITPKNLQELLSYAKGNPGTLNMGGSGSGLVFYQQLMNVADVKFAVVKYKGAAQVLADLLGGRLDATLTAVANVEQQVKAGQLRGIAISGQERNPALPDVPTFAEAGLPAFEPTTWFALFAPSGTPEPIISKINSAVRKLQEDPEVVKSLAALGQKTSPLTVEQSAEFFAKELESYGALIKQSGLKAD